MNIVREKKTGIKPSTLISLEEFRELYSAVEFASQFGRPPSAHVTIHWGLLFNGESCVTATEFTAFKKCVRDWLAQRQIPVIYIYSHESSHRAGLHTHFAVYVPRDRRTEFREYVRSWATLRYGRPPGTGIEVSGMEHDAITVWIVFSYLVKGYDRSVVVVSGRNHPSGRPLLLGDLIAYPWVDPGVVEMPRRVGTSSAIGKAQRDLGYPKGFEGQFAPTPVSLSSKDLFPPQDVAPFVHQHTWPERTASKEALSAAPMLQFRSKLEDGIVDVRKLYPPEFYRYVTRLDVTDTRFREDEEQVLKEWRERRTAELVERMAEGLWS